MPILLYSREHVEVCVYRSQVIIGYKGQSQNGTLKHIVPHLKEVLCDTHIMQTERIMNEMNFMNHAEFTSGMKCYFSWVGDICHRNYASCWFNED